MSVESHLFHAIISMHTARCAQLASWLASLWAAATLECVCSLMCALELLLPYVQSHPWFEGLDWDLLAQRKVPPPWMPPADAIAVKASRNPSLPMYDQCTDLKVEVCMRQTLRRYKYSVHVYVCVHVPVLWCTYICTRDHEPSSGSTRALSKL